MDESLGDLDQGILAAIEGKSTLVYALVDGAVSLAEEVLLETKDMDLGDNSLRPALILALTSAHISQNMEPEPDDQTASILAAAALRLIEMEWRVK